MEERISVLCLSSNLILSIGITQFVVCEWVRLLSNDKAFSEFHFLVWIFVKLQEMGIQISSDFTVIFLRLRFYRLFSIILWSTMCGSCSNRTSIILHIKLKTQFIRIWIWILASTHAVLWTLNTFFRLSYFISYLMCPCSVARLRGLAVPANRFVMVRRCP